MLRWDLLKSLCLWEQYNCLATFQFDFGFSSALWIRNLLRVCILCYTYMTLSFFFCFVLTLQWNREARILKMCHELIVGNCLLSREGGWLLITLTDFSIDNSPALPIRCATGMWFAEQACAKKKKKKGQSRIVHCMGESYPSLLAQEQLDLKWRCWELWDEWGFNSSRHVTVSTEGVGEVGRLN